LQKSRRCNKPTERKKEVEKWQKAAIYAESWLKTFLKPDQKRIKIQLASPKPDRHSSNAYALLQKN